MNNVPVTSVSLEGLHGHQDITIELLPGLNIVQGKNGTGKTTILHVLANLLDRDIGRFGYIRFSKIAVETAAGTRIQIFQKRAEGEFVSTVDIDGVTYGPVPRGAETPTELRNELRNKLGGRPVYLPAFR